MLFGTGVIYFVPLPFVPQMFDRYYLLFVPLAAVILLITCGRANATPQRWRVLGVVCLLAYGAFAIAGTRDYLAWQRTRWQVLRTLTVVRHIPPQHIDGGDEFNCTYRYPGHMWPVGDDIVISLGPVSGYAETERYTFRRLLPPGEGVIFVLQKMSPGPESFSNHDVR